MIEEFETAAAAICTGTWWNSSKSMFSDCLLPCSTESGPDDIGILGWQPFDALEVKEMLSCPESENNCSPVNGTTASLLDINLDSTSQIIGLGLSSSPSTSPPDWNKSIFTHAEGDDERKLDSKNFFEGLLELIRNHNNSPEEQFSSSWPRTAPILDSPVANLMPQQLGCLPCSDNLCLNESAVVSLLRDIRANFEDEPQACKSHTSKAMNEKAEESDGNDDDSPRLKRQRIETPSPLPSFKVRKEKLGDRITALQQLVSPFGKTDTASVLHEAIEYIKFLNEQVTVLSNPYTKSVAPIQRQQSSDKSPSRSQECLQAQDLRSRGLCLVPISSTFPIAAQMNTSDFWTLPFGINSR